MSEPPQAAPLDLTDENRTLMGVIRLVSSELELRPINHRLEQRVRAHAFLCMLAYYLEWHLRQAWKPLLFQDEQPPLSHAPVAKAERSPAATQKASTHKTATGETCHSFTTLLAELALIVRDTNRIAQTGATFTKTTQANPTQTRALQLAAANPTRL